MKNDNLTNIYRIYFDALTKEYGFKLKKEIINEQSYLLEYSCTAYTIKIEKYFREFYVTLYKKNDDKNEINLFNLLEYLNKSGNSPKSKYFREEKNIEECYKKQLSYLTSVFCNNYDELTNFFSDDNYEIKVFELEKYMQSKYPYLF